MNARRTTMAMTMVAGVLLTGLVAQAVSAVAPWGVDVAGGVESSVACKDSALVRQFVLNAKTLLT